MLSDLVDGRADARGRDRCLPARAADDRRARRGPHPRRLPPRRRVAGRPAHRPRAGRAGAGAAVDRLRQPADADRSRSRGCAPSGEVAELGTDDLRFDAAETGAAVHRDVRARARARRPRRRRRADRGLGRLAPARPGRAARPVAGRDPPLRPGPDRRRPGALRLPRRGGRRRPAGGPAAVPDADLDPAGRHPELAAVVTGLDAARSPRLTAAAERLTLLSRPSRTSRGPQRYHPLVREFLEARLRVHGRRRGGRRAPPTRGRGRRGERLARRRLPLPRGRRPCRCRNDDRQRRSPRSWAAASTPRPSKRSTGSRASRDCPSSALSRPECRCSNATIEPQSRCRDAILEAVEPGSQESDYALLNLMTAVPPSRIGPALRGACASDCGTTTSNEQLRLIADGTGADDRRVNRRQHRRYRRGILSRWRSAARRPPALLRRDDAQSRHQRDLSGSSRDCASTARDEAIEALRRRRRASNCRPRSDGARRMP